VARDVHEVTDGNNDLLDLLGELTGGGEDKRLAGLDVGVDLLEGRDGEGSRLTGTGLGLRDDIVAWWVVLVFFFFFRNHVGHHLPLMTGMMARCWIADGRSKP
jgi:hypothetical protein